MKDALVDPLFGHTVDAIRNRMIADALRRCACASEAAKKLGISRPSIYRWISDHDFANKLPNGRLVLK